MSLFSAFSNMSRFSAFSHQSDASLLSAQSRRSVLSYQSSDSVSATLFNQLLYQLAHEAMADELGDAFFDFDGLTHQGQIDTFWTDPQAPDASLFARFRAHVIAQTQVNGNYHEPRAMKATAAGIAAVFEKSVD
ncbi:MAG: hypothetical protein IE926_04450 [Micrococcales bacterium]|nr:hypothetical protein [Micrococcales bacterium]